MQYHDVANLLPMMSADELSELAEDIKQHGLREPIYLHDGKIIDGRNRYKACEQAGVEPKFRNWSGSGSLVAFVISENVKRRHLTASQRAVIGAEAEALFAEERKKNQKLSGGRGQKGQARMPDLKPGEQARDDAAKAVGVSPRYISDAKSIKEKAPDLVPLIRDGKLTVPEAKQASKSVSPVSAPLFDNEYSAAKPRRAITLSEWRSFTVAERSAAISRRSSTAKLNKQDNTSIEWARWSWNPVTGCLHNCPYCYARDIANRYYPQKFEPSIVPEALAAPFNVQPPADAAEDLGWKNIFTCSMADLFGNWIPSEWIEAVLGVVREAKQWNFLMLTKFPQRLKEFEFPDNAWLGTTVDLQARVAIAERSMRDVKASVKWLSLEPLIEPLKIDFSIFRWVVVGGASRSTETPEWKPPRRWVRDLTFRAEEAGCKVYHKTNLNLERLREYPGWSDGEPTRAPDPFQYLKVIA